MFANRRYMICEFLLYRSVEDKGTALLGFHSVQLAKRMKRFRGDLVASSFSNEANYMHTTS